ncbi:molybdopterin-binding protein [Sediminimonas sp.]|uniref:molybdopterin-binding protein n=1 Tax=Sediminimonas sp. TaxID=2823379 RepID=UPI0025F31578|nr:molybdopterin-binding protein [Sediminimonas sp.]
MKFGRVPVDRAQGAILAHSLALPGGRLRKGQVLGPEQVAALTAAGHAHVTVARPEPGDVPEDAAAARLADALVPDPQAARLRLAGAFTGRVNLAATTAGVAVIDADAVTAVNRVDPAITLATVPPWLQMRPGGMIATVKIIPYAVGKAQLDRACAAGRGALRVQPPVYRSASLILTDAGGANADKLANKGRRAVRARLETLGMDMACTQRVTHDSAALAAAIEAAHGDMILILTASATSDARDVAPEALRAAGGRLDRFGIPVDPGNLLFLGTLGARPVIGLPGSARSTALHGADWMLSRIACGLPPDADEIAAMGVGGLLKEIPTRPMPRTGPRPAGDGG